MSAYIVETANGTFKPDKDDENRDDYKECLNMKREYAEKAYTMMMTPLTNEKRDIQRAQNKVSGIISALVKRKQIRL